MHAFAKKRTRLVESRGQLAVVIVAWQEQRTLSRVMADALHKLAGVFRRVPFTSKSIAVVGRRELDILRGLARDVLASGAAEQRAEQAGDAAQEDDDEEHRSLR